jgi:hypothetical protein
VVKRWLTGVEPPQEEPEAPGEALVRARARGAALVRLLVVPAAHRDPAALRAAVLVAAAVRGPAECRAMEAPRVVVEHREVAEFRAPGGLHALGKRHGAKGRRVPMERREWAAELVGVLDARKAPRAIVSAVAGGHLARGVQAPAGLQAAHGALTGQPAPTARVAAGREHFRIANLAAHVQRGSARASAPMALALPGLGAPAPRRVAHSKPTRQMRPR